MTIKEFFNAYVGNYGNIKVYKYAGSYNTIGADLETDYEEVYNGKYRFMPEEYRKMEIEYFTIEEGDFYIYLKE